MIVNLTLQDLIMLREGAWKIIEGGRDELKEFINAAYAAISISEEALSEAGILPEDSGFRQSECYNPHTIGSLRVAAQMDKKRKVKEDKIGHLAEYILQRLEDGNINS